MLTLTRYLLDQLAAAIVDGDAERTFYACQDLAERIGLEAAVALARELARDEAPKITVPPRLVVTMVPGLAMCA